MKSTTKELIAKMLSESGLQQYEQVVTSATATICECFANGNRLYVCGNGGSAADCEHIVGEFAKSFTKKRPLPDEFRQKFLTMFPDDELLALKTEVGLPAYSLVSQSGIATAVNNDIGGEYVFSQQVYAYVNGGDVLVAISTSGNSVAVANAVKIAKAKGAIVVALTGKDGGVLKRLADVCVCSAQKETYRIQQEHIVFYHAICAAVEEELL